MLVLEILQIRALSKGEAGQNITYTARRVIPDETLIPELEKWNRIWWSK